MCVCGLSSKEIAGTHTHMPRRTPPPPHRRAFPMSCYTDVFPGQEPPSTHSFPTSHVLLSLFLFVCFDSHCLLLSRLSRGNDHDQHNHLFEIRYRRERWRRRERGGLDWSSRRPGSSARASTIPIYAPSMEGPSFLCQRHSEELDFYLFFQRYPQLQSGCGGERKTQGEREKGREESFMRSWWTVAAGHGTDNI